MYRQIALILRRHQTSAPEPLPAGLVRAALPSAAVARWRAVTTSVAFDQGTTSALRGAVVLDDMGDLLIGQLIGERWHLGFISSLAPALRRIPLAAEALASDQLHRREFAPDDVWLRHLHHLGYRALRCFGE
jgi:hypothetical protein